MSDIDVRTAHSGHRLSSNIGVAQPLRRVTSTAKLPLQPGRASQANYRASQSGHKRFSLGIMPSVYEKGMVRYSLSTQERRSVRDHVGPEQNAHKKAMSAILALPFMSLWATLSSRTFDGLENEKLQSQCIVTVLLLLLLLLLLLMMLLFLSWSWSSLFAFLNLVLAHYCPFLSCLLFLNHSFYALASYSLITINTHCGRYVLSQSWKGERAVPSLEPSPEGNTWSWPDVSLPCCT